MKKIKMIVRKIVKGNILKLQRMKSPKFIAIKKQDLSKYKKYQLKNMEMIQRIINKPKIIPKL